MTAPSTRRSLWASIGPGILFAGAAVGVSHLVQSTRAGAKYGLVLLGAVVLANVIKYPAFRFGPHYAAATRTSLLEGYRRQGRWALVLYGMATVGTMFTVQAAVALVTAGLAKALIGSWLGRTVGHDPSLVVYVAVLLGLCAVLVATGGYRWLDRVGKIVVTALTLATLVATAMLLPSANWSAVPGPLELSRLTLRDAAFLAALIGWMPSAVDVAVWQSLWTLARSRDAKTAPDLSRSTTDFHIGYIGTALLALCFVVLGAGAMYGRGEIAPQAVAFATQLIDLYGRTLGEWSKPVIAVAALFTMFSTTLTVVDGFPRALSGLVERFALDEVPLDVEAERGEERTTLGKRVYWGVLVVLGLGSIGVIVFLLRSLRALIDLATTLSFLSAPALSWLNHRAVTSSELPPEARPRSWLVWMSAICIALQAVFALGYLVVRFAL